MHTHLHAWSHMHLDIVRFITASEKPNVNNNREKKREFIRLPLGLIYIFPLNQSFDNSQFLFNYSLFQLVLC